MADSFAHLIERQQRLVTPRLVLRRPVEADMSSIVELANDWDVVRRLGRLPYPYTLADARYFLEQVVSQELSWSITSADRGALLGVVGLSPEPKGNAAELGYWLGRRYWGKGIATEAGRAVVETAFQALGFDFLTSGYFVDNPASGRVLSKLGFVETGAGQRSCLALGSMLPSVELELRPTSAAG
jgi:RimJ/RimL family protein N-acetyltransferase